MGTGEVHNLGKNLTTLRAEVTKYISTEGEHPVKYFELSEACRFQNPFEFWRIPKTGRLDSK